MSWTIEDVQLPSRREDPVGDDVWVSALRHGGMAEFSWADRKNADNLRYLARK